MRPNSGSTESLSEDTRTFCVFHVDESGHVLTVDELEADNDLAAIDHVRRHYQCEPGTGIELWREDRRVYARLEPRASHH
jgi:hypothetical protein